MCKNSGLNLGFSTIVKLIFFVFKWNRNAFLNKYCIKTVLGIKKKLIDFSFAWIPKEKDMIKMCCVGQYIFRMT